MKFNKREFIKTDRNGTKYFLITETCPRCGGRGDYILGGYNYGVCFECNGSCVKQYTFKEYTPEHEAKLEKQRKARAEKRLAKWQKEEEAREAERVAQEAAEAKERAEKEAAEAARKAVSQYVGQVGDKLTITVTLERAINYEVPSFRGYGEDVMTIYVFRDANGNKLVWKTSGSLVTYDENACRYNYVEIGQTFSIKGTVKAHSEYDGEMQTELQRVKRV